jgi:hypothetical protein
MATDSDRNAAAQLLEEAQRLEVEAHRAAERARAVWARAEGGGLSPEEQARAARAASELARARELIGDAAIDGAQPSSSDTDRLIAEIQALFRHIPPGVSLADELITERRREVERERDDT